jgi:5-methyltetrahydrofolate--homocysteine methyltransferase
MELLPRIAKGLEEGDDELVRSLTGEALATGVSAADVLNNGLLAGMAVIGERFRLREIFLPDVLLAAKAMYAGLDVLRPRLADENVPPRAKIVIGSVRGDLHDIGKNLVGIMLKGAGFDVIDLGHDVPAETFVETAIASGATVVGMSALLTTTMPRMKDVVDLLRAREPSGRIRTIVGGAPVTAEFARTIGADGWAFDAGSAVARVTALLEAD